MFSTYRDTNRVSIIESDNDTSLTDNDISTDIVEDKCLELPDNILNVFNRLNLMDRKSTTNCDLSKKCFRRAGEAPPIKSENRRLTQLTLIIPKSEVLLPDTIQEFNEESFCNDNKENLPQDTKSKCISQESLKFVTPKQPAVAPGQKKGLVRGSSVLSLANKNNYVKKEFLEDKLNRSESFCSSNTKRTVPKPFSFFAKDEAMLKHRQQMVEDELKEKKRLASAFRANPAPKFESPVNVEKKLVPKITSPKPFSFESDQRIAYYQEKLQDSKSSNNSFGSSNSTQRLKRNLSYMYRNPFQPQKSIKEPTEPKGPNLVIEERLVERAKFDEEARQEMELGRRNVADYYRELEEIELEKARIQRQNAVVKAKPIRRFKPTNIVHNRVYTVPISPKLSSRIKK